MKFIIFLIFAIEASLSFRLAPRAGCNIEIPDLSPEAIVATTETLEFVYPEPGANAVSLQEGQTVYISCPGGQLTAGSSRDVTVVATCVSGSTFDVAGESVNFNNIRCSRNPFHTARYSGASCENNGREIEVGFILSDETFVRELRICFDEANLDSLYSEYHLTKSIASHESGVNRPSFIADDFYNVNVNSLYERNGQRNSINSLVGLSPSSTKYIQDNDYFLSRGHLSAKADFVYAPQQLATFHYVNVAPQWQTVNGANWNTVEMDVRSYAEDNEVDLIVITGTYGVATLPHEETGEDIELYLYVEGKGLRVPEVYWKLVYNPENKEAIALISLNNPYKTDVTSSVICRDISASISWLNWKRDDIQAGYSYACTYEELKEKVSYLPDLDVQGVLM